MATGGLRGPESPTQLGRRSWWRVMKRTVSEFQSDNLGDWAAALTYYAVLALFPMLIVLVALLGLAGEGNTIDTLIGSLDRAGLSGVAKSINRPLHQVVMHKGGAGALLGFALLGSLWSASGYVGGFMGPGNGLSDVGEGGPFGR